jgi:hypothetical protein
MDDYQLAEKESQGVTADGVYYKPVGGKQGHKCKSGKAKSGEKAPSDCCIGASRYNLLSLMMFH